MTHRLLSLSAAALALLSLSSCHHTAEGRIEFGEAQIDLDSIRARGVLRAVTDYNSVDYFVHKGVSVGYQYELLSEYARHLGVKLEIVADNELDGEYDKLVSGRADILAASLVADSTLLPDMYLCEPYGQSRLVIVGRFGECPPPDSGFVALDGDTVCVTAHSFYAKALERMVDSADVDIEIEEIPHYDSEQLVGLVAEHEIGMTLCLESVAKANQWYYDSLFIGPAVSSQVDLSWGVRRSSPALRDDISQWMKSFRRTALFRRIYRKYVIDPREHHSNSQSVSASTYQSTYEHIIKEVAQDGRYDWLLVSSVVYQESHFNPMAHSWAGATGLMQLMPETGARFGSDDLYDPQQNIEAGYAYLLWLDARLAPNVPDARERVKFVLAAYNVGLGHLMDAIRLAEKFGKNAQMWDANVETAILLKANPTYYSDPVVKHGFCRATETVAYVKNVIDRYRNYKKALL